MDYSAQIVRPRLHQCHIHIFSKILLSGAGDIDWFNAKRQLLGVVMQQGGRLDVQVDLCCERTGWFSASGSRQLARWRDFSSTRQENR